MSWSTFLRRVWRAGFRRNAVSDEYEIVRRSEAAADSTGWTEPAVAARQHAAFAPLVAALRAGKVREDFRALAEAVGRTGLDRPDILELGCGSGWNCEVLQILSRKPFRYTGLDCSQPMIDIARRAYPAANFVVGDAVATGLPDGCCDILISGTVLMHLANYEQAIAESRRLTRAWCIFHTVPVLHDRATTFLHKRAYGQPTVEIVFNEKELLDLFARYGLRVVHTLDSLPYDLVSVLGEHNRTRSYICRVES